MPVTVELSDEALARLEAEAEAEAEAVRRGVSVDVVINELAARLSDEGARARGQGLIGLGASLINPKTIHQCPATHPSQ